MASENPPCGGCGGPHPFDTSVPSVLWNRVIRPLGGSEYLCATCVLTAFAKAGVSFTAELYGDDFNGLPIAVEVNGATATAPLELSEENNRLRVLVSTLWQLAATFDSAQCNAIRDSIHRHYARSLPV